MEKLGFDPDKRLGEGIGRMRRQELCALVSELCAYIRARAGAEAYHGGVYPENISIQADGSVALGPGRLSGWEGQELQFVAPELYWGGQVGPAADVYALGMLLYYGATGGHLPFEGEEPEQAQADRVNGKGFAVPTIVPRQLREIIIKATAFKAADRYQQVEELQAMVESCMKDKYLRGEPSAQVLFNKDRQELSDLERIMVSIIDEEPEGAASAETPASPEAEEEAAPAPATEDAPEVPTESAEAQAPAEDAAPDEDEDRFPVLGTPPEKREDPEAAAAQALEDEEMERLRALFNAPIREPELGQGVVPELPEESGDAPREDLEPVPLAMISEEGDVRVYEPVHGRREPKAPERQPIPILTVDNNPELEPVVPQTAAGSAWSGGAALARDVQKRRRRQPVTVVLVLCALLILAAIIANAMLSDPTVLRGGSRPGDAAGEGDASGFVSVPTARPMEQDAPATEPPFDYASLGNLDPEKDIDLGQDPATAEHRDEVVASNKSWLEAQADCLERGGYLAVISSQEEMDKVTQLVAESGLSRVWVGCRRVDGSLVWENNDEVLYYPWDVGEPSYEDGYDGAAEDYLLLWYHNGWVYNDSRNDPVADYPEWYVGTIGFVCEYDR